MKERHIHLLVISILSTTLALFILWGLTYSKFGPAPYSGTAVVVDKRTDKYPELQICPKSGEDCRWVRVSDEIFDLEYPDSTVDVRDDHIVYEKVCDDC